MSIRAFFFFLNIRTREMEEDFSSLIIWSIELAGGIYGIVIGLYLALASDLPTSSKYLSVLFIFGGALVIALLVIDRLRE